MIGLVIMIVGAAGILISTAFEIHTRAKIYEIMMKIFPLVFAIGTLFWKFGG